MSPRKFPIGIQRCNPGNLRPTPELITQPFEGTLAFSLKEPYLAFEAPYFGIRASGICVLKAQLVHGIRNLIALGDHWSPPGDNPGKPPGSYGSDLGRILKVDPEKDLDFNLWLETILHGIFENENGQDTFHYVPCWYAPVFYGAGSDAARIHLKIEMKSFPTISPSRFVIPINRGINDTAE